ncbi:NlpC/P60 family protein [Kocuria sp. CPCC 205268]|uniref:C40 family peptidase n=1 Tax=Kocuria TaxID=57493 RepID=UPI002F926E55
MAFFTRSSARHRAQTPSHLVRTTTLAAAVGAAVIGSVAPAQAYAEAPATTDTAYSAPATSPTPAASQSPVTVQTASQPDAPAAGQATSSLSPQSSDISEISAAAGGIVGTAMQGVGTGYVWGGTDFGAWDCSGFTQWVYAQQGIDIPRTSQQQWAAGTPTTDPQPGDLVVQNGGAHIGIYLGGGKMISALNPTQGTFVHSVNAMPTVGYVTFR